VGHLVTAKGGWHDKGNKIKINLDNLILNVFFIIIINSLLNPLLWLSNFKMQIKHYMRGKMLAQGILRKETSTMTQKEVNDLFENHEIDFGQKFSHICNIVLIVFFYLPVFPIGVPIAMAGLCFAFYVEKYNILRHYNRSKMEDPTVVKALVIHFKIFIFVFSVFLF
jgi:hypothetical protein